MINADMIRLAINFKYSTKGNEYSVYHEFRTCRGFNRVRYIDALVIGHWEKSRDIIGFEIKVSKSDFDSDIQKFTEKQGPALEICNEYYFVGPKGVIDPVRLPAGIGVMELGTTNKLRVIKPAEYKQIDSWDRNFISALASRTEDEKKVVPANVMRFLGKDITDDNFNDFIRKDVNKRMEWEINNAAKRLQHEWKDKESESHVKNYKRTARLVETIIRIAGGGMLGQDNSETIDKVTQYFRKCQDVVRNVQALKNQLNELDI